MANTTIDPVLNVNDLKNKKQVTVSTQALQAELARVQYNRKLKMLILDTFFRFVIAAAVAVLLSTLFFPVLILDGNSMAPSYYDEDVVLCFKGQRYHQGDIIAFYFNNHMLVKRVIAEEGQWVQIEDDGTVYVDDEILAEPYLVDCALGNCDIEFPYQVPSDSYFVMGDHRSTSLDSRTTEIGCVRTEYIVGEILCKIIPAATEGEMNA